jgi:hypothetical protein
MGRDIRGTVDFIQCEFIDPDMPLSIPHNTGHLLQEWPELVYPPYANGPGYVISANIARDIASRHANQSLRVRSIFALTEPRHPLPYHTYHHRP